MGYFQNEAVQYLWRKASLLLKDAVRIFLVGYSLPATDLTMRFLFSNAARQLHLVHERFAGPEIKIFHRSGIHPISYADTMAGPDMPNLTYIIPFASLGDREKAWDTFNVDAEWLKAREESIARGGQIVNYQNLSIWRATPFSPIQ